jgi:hypothetical protein
MATGMNITDMSYFQKLKSSGVNRVNILLKKPLGGPEPFAIGQNVVQEFRERAAGTECHEIIGRTFSDWTGFQEHMSSSDKCAELIEYAGNEAIRAIKKLI